MTSIPSNLSRVPTVLGNQILMGSINRTHRELLELNLKMATGQRVNQPSDDAAASSLVHILDRLIADRGQTLRNLQHAESVLNNADAAIADANDIVLEARSIASSQVGFSADPTTRANQAKVIEAMVSEMVNIANRQFQDIYLFGGAETATAPISELLGGLRYNGRGAGLQTDLDLAPVITITSGAESVFGGLSSRVQGQIDLDPGATTDTRLADLKGAQGVGVRKGVVAVDINGTEYELDLSGADTVGDVLTALEGLINDDAPGALAGGGVALNASGNAVTIDLNPGFQISISDPGGTGAATDLGLADAAQPFEDGLKETGFDFDPRLTERTAITSLNGLANPLGTVRLTNAGQSRDLDLSGVTTVQELVNAVRGLDLGVRVEVNEAGDRLTFVNELSGGSMSVAEVSGGTTATDLGVRSLAASTALSVFNDGRGVRIRSGSVDPITGAPHPQADLDLQVTLKDGRSFDVDLAGAETVQDVLDAINAAAAAAPTAPPIGVPADFEAALASDGNGIDLTDNTGPGTTTVSALNGSKAAEDLGILGATDGAVLAGQDRATVAVDSVFAHLMALREALEANDERGITLAGEALEADLDRLGAARAETGIRTRRVTDAVIRLEDLDVQDRALKSEVQDLDFTEAAIRFALLQQQLQAALATAGQATSLSLLDFLG